MKILRAEHLGMCFGVRDAIDFALSQAKRQPLTILGDLVHNESVLADLRARGITIATAPAEIHSRNVMITAHGASERTMARVRAGGHAVHEATCPLVHAAHRAVSNLAAAGYHVIIIGKRDHVEVRGLTEDLDAFDVILSEADINQLSKHSRFGVAAQTTQPIERVIELVRCLSERFPLSEVRFVDTVCRPTKQRQQAAVDLARQCDLVLVIGGRDSNNTRELVNTCQRYCRRVLHIQSAADLRPDWFEGAKTIGITA
ncbi:MAG TPA: 4-hydroxy-3-methylbut-2-enyl diphosphate reductase, partial [Verrucomicrobiae bacterium]|nr:4-hydroxy-3-methylbut-2-enyl diphosphate reductase [Verrucomicrobiae bacterium]